MTTDNPIVFVDPDAREGNSGDTLETADAERSLAGGLAPD